VTGTGTLYERRGRGFRVAHATVAKDAKVDSRNGTRGGLSGLRVRGFRFSHATVAKEAKVDARNEIRGGLSGLGVIFSLGTKKDPRGIAPRV
jgi:hypothetical protein